MNTRILIRDIYFVECILFMVLHFLLTSDGNIYRLMVLTFTLLVLVFAIIISSNVVLSNTQTQNVWPSTFQMHTDRNTPNEILFSCLIAKLEHNVGSECLSEYFRFSCFCWDTLYAIYMNELKEKVQHIYLPSAKPSFQFL